MASLVQYSNVMAPSWRGGPREVDAGLDPLLLGEVLLVAYISWRAQISLQEQRAAEGGSRVPDCPLNHDLHTCTQSTTRYTFLLPVRHVLSYS